MHYTVIIHIPVIVFKDMPWKLIQCVGLGQKIYLGHSTEPKVGQSTVTPKCTSVPNRGGVGMKEKTLTRQFGRQVENQKKSGVLGSMWCVQNLKKIKQVFLSLTGMFEKGGFKRDGGPGGPPPGEKNKEFLNVGA